jgi:predicted permease
MTILETIVPVFIIIGLSYALQMKKRLDMKPLIETGIYLASPCLIFGSLSSKAYSLHELLPVISSAGVVITGALVLSRVIFVSLKLSEIDARSLPVVLLNAGNLGLPISLFAFGEEGLGIAVMFFVTSALFTYTLGVFLAARSNKESDRPWLEVFKLPLIYAAISGVIVSTLGIEIPEMIARPIDLLGQAAIPLFLISLGMSLVEVKPREHLPAALLSASMRIGIGLSLGVAVTMALGLDGLLRQVIIVQSAMPPAVASYMLSKKYECRPDLVAATIFVGTLMSMVTIPLILGFVS